MSWRQKNQRDKSPKLFYGWVIVAVAFLIGFTEAGVFQNILSIFLKPMAEEFGWSRTIITGSIAFGSVCGGVVAPFMGPILDRHGPRIIAFWGVFLLSTGLVALSFLSRVWELYIFFSMGRMIAVGVLSLVIAVSISNWFVQQRGRAMGIAHLGSRVGTAIFPPFVAFMIFSFGWRMAWGALGLVVFLLSALPALIFLKRKPEDMGLQPDGKVHVEGFSGEKNDLTHHGEPPLSRHQIIRHSDFWILITMTCFITFSGGGANFHIYPFLTDRGIPGGIAVIVISVIAIASAAGGLVLGFIAEKFPPKKLLSITAVLLGAMFLTLFWAAKSNILMFIAAILFGILRGGVMPLVPLAWADSYGRASIGSVLGLSAPFRLTANALGPVFGSVCFDITGGYIISFTGFAGLFLMAGLLGLLIKTGPRE